MIEHESHCVGCPGMGLSCIGASCPNHDPVAVVSCDQCGDNDVTIYQDDAAQLCARCLAYGKTKRPPASGGLFSGQCFK